MNKLLQFIPIANAVAVMSKNPKRKIGALILSRDLVIVSTGYNGLPRDVHEFTWRYEQPEKNFMLCHAEENAIVQAARTGAVTVGGIIIVTGLMPCATCTRMIIQAGIKIVMFPEHDIDPRWEESFKRSRLMLEEAGRVILTYKETENGFCFTGGGVQSKHSWDNALIYTEIGNVCKLHRP